MDTKTEKIDMLNGPLAKKIFLFTLPIASSSMLQQLFNAADTSIVGYFDGANALAGVGTNGEIIALIVTLSSGLSIGVNIFFVIILRIGVAGVAIATVLSTLLSAILVLKKLWKGDPVFHLSVLPFHINTSYAGQILKTGIPSAIQGAVFCFANIFVQASVNRFGAVAIEPVILFRNTFCGLFSSEQAVIANAGIRIMCILLYEPICNLYEIPAGVLRGCGHASIPAIMTILGTCLFRITWICTVFEQKKRLEAFFFAHHTHFTPFFTSLPFCLFGFCFYDEARNGTRLSIFIHGNDGQICSVDRSANTIHRLYIGINTHFHGCMSDISDLGDHDNKLIDIGTSDKMQIVYRCSDHIGLGMTVADKTCHLVNPRHQLSTKQPSHTVHMHRAELVNLLYHRILYSFFLGYLCHFLFIAPICFKLPINQMHTQIM